MRILVTGALGMLGRDVVSEIAGRGHEAITLDLADLDITDPVSVSRIPEGEFGQIDWIVNCAAYTAVDKAESEERLATEVNGLAVGYLANAASFAGAKFLQISTDFVFDGKATEPYVEDAPVRPLGAYGRSKLVGEEAALANNANSLVVRTAWLYGPLGNSFPRTMIRAFEAAKNLKVVADQVGNPTYTGDLARTLVDLIDKNAFPGIYHATGPDTMSWHQFATLAIAIWTGETPSIEAISSDQWPTPAARPMFSALANNKIRSLGIEPMRPTPEALEAFCSRLRQTLI